MPRRFFRVLSEYQMLTNSCTDRSSLLAISSATGARKRFLILRKAAASFPAIRCASSRASLIRLSVDETLSIMPSCAAASAEYQMLIMA